MVRRVGCCCVVRVEEDVSVVRSVGSAASAKRGRSLVAQWDSKCSLRSDDHQKSPTTTLDSLDKHKACFIRDKHTRICHQVPRSTANLVRREAPRLRLTSRLYDSLCIFSFLVIRDASQAARSSSRAWVAVSLAMEDSTNVCTNTSYRNSSRTSPTVAKRSRQCHKP